MTKVREAVLMSLKVGGLLSLAFISPQVAGLVAKKTVNAQRDSARSALARLIRKGLVVKRDGKFQITPKGMSLLDKHLLSPARPKRWDGKWRVVIFDIPETRKAYRNVLRDSLRRIGFLKLQNSAWIYPHDCEELVALLKADYRLGKEVIYMIVDHIENDRALRENFKLKKR